MWEQCTSCSARYIINTSGSPDDSAASYTTGETAVLAIAVWVKRRALTHTAILLIVSRNLRIGDDNAGSLSSVNDCYSVRRRLLNQFVIQNNGSVRIGVCGQSRSVWVYERVFRKNISIRHLEAPIHCTVLFIIKRDCIVYVLSTRTKEIDAKFADGLNENGSDIADGVHGCWRKEFLRVTCIRVWHKPLLRGGVYPRAHPRISVWNQIIRLNIRSICVLLY